jgi:uncharacterized FlgJ-related protein
MNCKNLKLVKLSQIKSKRKFIQKVNPEITKIKKKIKNKRKRLELKI